MRSWSGVVVAALLLGALSGCVGTKYEYVTVTRGLSTEVGEFNGSIPEGKGVLEGTVLSSDGIRLANSHIALLGTRESQTTDRRGRFTFPGLDPGPYVVRVDHDGYRGVQHGVTVLQGKIVKAEIVLEPSGSLAPGQREHLHDLWEGEETKVLFDRDVYFAKTTNPKKTTFPTGACVGGAGTGNSGSALCYHAPFHLPEGQVVPPWTERLEVKLDWTDTSFSTVDLRYKNPKTGVNALENKSIPRGSTIILPVNESTADHGHARWSAWAFAIMARPQLVAGQSATTYSTDWTNEDRGPIRAKVVAFRGDEYPERPHSRYWANGSRLILMQDEEHSHSAIGREANAPQAGYSCGTGASCFQPTKIVPPGTTRLVVTLTYKPTTEGWPINNEKGLALRTAKINPHTATWDDLRVEDYVNKNGNVYTFEYKIAPDETDPYYGKRTTFALFPNPKGQERSPDLHTDCGAGCGGDRYKMTIEAINDNWRPEYAVGAVEA